MPEKTQRSFYEPILRILRKMGGAGKKSDIITRIVKERGFTDDDMDEQTETGYSVIDTRIAWARHALVSTGYLQTRTESGYGVWALTQKGLKVDLSTFDANAITSANNLFWRESPKKTKPKVGARKQSEETLPPPESEEASPPPEEEYRARLLNKLRGLKPETFEHVCKRLLGEIGFVGLEVTKKTRDGGFDGFGHLEVNPLVKISIVFECKRYGEKNPIAVGAVDKFKGATEGKFERRMIITTSRFTSDAVKAAMVRSPHIELISGDNLVDLFVKHKLGVKEVPSYEIDDDFFVEFDSDKNSIASNSAEKKKARAAKKPARTGKRVAKKRRK